MGVGAIGNEVGYYGYGTISRSSKSNDGSNFGLRVNDKNIYRDEEFLSTEKKFFSSVHEIYQRESVHRAIADNNYSDISTQNYNIRVDANDGILRISDSSGNHLGTFSLNDVKIKKDSQTGTELVVSEHGTMSYDAIALNEELKNALAKATGIEELETLELKGFSIKTHPGTGLQVLMREGDEGRGGKTLIRSEADQKAFDRLVDEYATQYPNLISDGTAAAIYADLEVRGLAQHTPNGIFTMGYNGINYNDNDDYKRDWSIHFRGNANEYQQIMDWFDKNKNNLLEMEKHNSWMDVFKEIGEYERIWSKEELDQGYLNN